jgi:hypothetical protein
LPEEVEQTNVIQVIPDHLRELVKTDLLIESAFILLKRNSLYFFLFPRQPKDHINVGDEPGIQGYSDGVQALLDRVASVHSLEHMVTTRL